MMIWILIGAHSNLKAVKNLAVLLMKFVGKNNFTFYWKNLKYYNFVLYSSRKQAFNRTIQRINELNRKYNEGTLSYVSGINQFSDLVFVSFKLDI